MSNENPTQDLRKQPFEYRLLRILESLQAELLQVSSRLSALEQHAYDTKPIWERALDEIMDTRREMQDFRHETRRKPSDN